MKSLNFIIILFLIFSSASAQEITKEMLLKRDLKIDSLRKIDFIGYKYKYLDKDFKFKISKKEYEKSIKKNKVYPEKILKYRDSLSVILMAEFKDWDAARIAELKITYTWERVGFHIWKNKEEVEEIAKRLNIKHPYRLQELLLRDDPKVSAEIENLRNKLFLKFNTEGLKTMPSDKLLVFAFSNNPEVMELRKNARAKAKKNN